MLFNELRRDNKKQNIDFKRQLWLLGEILLNECNARSLDVFGYNLYLDSIEGSRKSICLSVEAYETKYKVHDLDGTLLKYNGLVITIKYPDRNIYTSYSDKIENRILRINYLSSNNRDEVPFGFNEAKIIHSLDKKNKIGEIKSKEGHRNFTKLKNICNEIT